MIVEQFLQTYASSLMQGSWLVLGIAFVAGVLSSAICPFTLPIGLGVAGVVGTSESLARGSGFPIATSFFAGIVVSLTALGALAGLLGVVVTQAFGQYWTLAMALLAFVAALLILWGFPLQLIRLTTLRRPGWIGAFIYGLIFSLGTPAASLLVLITVAAAQQRPEYGAALAFGYGLGRGLPFLLIGLFSGTATRLSCRPSWSRTVQVISGSLLLVITGYYLWIFKTLL